MEVLKIYDEQLGQLIAASRGTIGLRAGDGLMVFFNDPCPCEQPSLEAARLAVAMRAAFAEARRKWERLGNKLTIGIGIASGYATLGLVGAEGRRDYTAIGNVVNLASRLCDHAQDVQIPLDRRAFLEAEEGIAAEPAGTLDLKGIGQDVEAYALRALSRKPGRSLLETPAARLRSAAKPCRGREGVTADPCGSPLFVLCFCRDPSWRNAASRKVWEGGRPNQFRGLDVELATDLLLALNVAKSLQDLSPLKSVGLHKLKGDRAGQWAVKVNGPWRICSEFRRGDAYAVEIVDYHKG